MNAPQLETPRLALRAFEESDFEGYARMCADPDAMRYLGTGKPLSAEEAWRSLAFFMGHWQLRGFGMWAVTEKESGQLVGRIGFHQPHGWPGFEMGWLVDPACWGRGYAPEAAGTLLPLAKTQYGQSRVISLIDPGNAASIRVAEKIGETRAGEARIFDTDVLVYAIDLKEAVPE